MGLGLCPCPLDGVGSAHPCSLGLARGVTAGSEKVVVRWLPLARNHLPLALIALVVVVVLLRRRGLAV